MSVLVAVVVLVAAVAVPVVDADPACDGGGRTSIPDGFVVQACFDGSQVVLENHTSDVSMKVSLTGVGVRPTQLVRPSQPDAAAVATELAHPEGSVLPPGYQMLIPVGVDPVNIDVAPTGGFITLKALLDAGFKPAVEGVLAAAGLPPDLAGVSAGALKDTLDANDKLRSFVDNYNRFALDLDANEAKGQACKQVSDIWKRVACAVSNSAASTALLAQFLARMTPTLVSVAVNITLGPLAAALWDDLVSYGPYLVERAQLLAAPHTLIITAAPDTTTTTSTTTSTTTTTTAPPTHVTTPTAPACLVSSGWYRVGPVCVQDPPGWEPWQDTPHRLVLKPCDNYACFVASVYADDQYDLELSGSGMVGPFQKDDPWGWNTFGEGNRDCFVPDHSHLSAVASSITVSDTRSVAGRPSEYRQWAVTCDNGTVQVVAAWIVAAAKVIIVAGPIPGGYMAAINRMVGSAIFP